MAGIAQDWEPVVIRKKAPTAAARKDEKAVNAARRAGAEIETVKKCAYLYSYFFCIHFCICDLRFQLFMWEDFVLALVYVLRQLMCRTLGTVVGKVLFLSRFLLYFSTDRFFWYIILEID